MDVTQSPAKRRALAPLDANALSTPRPAGVKDASPIRKRAIGAAAAASSRPEKKTCVEDETRSRSGSPDESSLFDNNDASWASNTTLDVSPAPRVLTREQAREKAEILRLRLGLASYKVRTGQTNVPLSELVAKPLPLRKLARDAGDDDAPPANNDKPKEAEQQQQKEEKHEVGNEARAPGPELPHLRGGDVTATPRGKEMIREDERLTSSALRGGAASGLLSLARGGSAE